MIDYDSFSRCHLTDIFFAFHAGANELKKETICCEAQVRRSRRKDLYRTERDSLEGPHDEAEIQRKALRSGKKLGLQRRYMLKKGKSAVEGDPKKSWSGIEMEAGAE